MGPILDFVAEIAFWGSAALIAWGAILTLFDSEFKRERPQAPAGRGEPMTAGGRPGLAS
jgi:hypothetical protein